MVIRTGLLSGPSASREKASAYLRPSWKMCPISMPRAASSTPVPSGDGSPARTSAASIVPSGVKSRPTTRSTTWWSALSAPVTHAVPVTIRGSTRKRTPFAASAPGPM